MFVCGSGGVVGNGNGSCGGDGIGYYGDCGDGTGKDN